MHRGRMNKIERGGYVVSRGKIIDIEGLDGCGKQTQSIKLVENLEKLGYKVKLISAPYYGKWHCAFVERHLDGYFGGDAKSINPYMASTFYAVDRLGAYTEEWKQYYEDGYVIICDRYVGSNIMYQSTKVDGVQEKLNFINWLEHLEYVVNGLPRPDVTILLSLLPQTSAKLRVDRLNKATLKEEHDIYESNLDFLCDTFTNSLFVASTLGWEKVDCDTGGIIRSIDDIADEVLEKVLAIIE